MKIGLLIFFFLCGYQSSSTPNTDHTVVSKTLVSIAGIGLLPFAVREDQQPIGYLPLHIRFGLKATQIELQL